VVARTGNGVDRARQGAVLEKDAFKI
jgi:hypothetical protein